jgi:hypothetical protein
MWLGMRSLVFELIVDAQSIMSLLWLSVRLHT